jgi:hypothetical protein
MKKRTAASSHKVKALGPALAAVATQVIPITATRLKRTKSRKVRARSSCGAVLLDAVIPQKCMNIRRVSARNGCLF